MAQTSDKACQKILLAAEITNKKAIDDLQKKAEASNVSLSQIVVHSGLLTEPQLLDLFAKSAGSVCVDLKQMSVDKDLIAKIPVKFVGYYKFFPVKLQNRKLTIAVSRLVDVQTLDEIRFGLGYEVETVFASEKDVEDSIQHHYGLGAETVDRILKKSPEKGKARVSSSVQEVHEEDLEKTDENASVVQLVNQIILEAYRKRASDIHIEPYRGKVRLRYRIDGKLQEMRVPPEMDQFLPALLSRIKIMANLDIVERRLPQDGKARVKTQDQMLNLRVSTIPTPHGESMVVRILPTKMILQLEELGFEGSDLELFKGLLSHPHGIIFVTGPTGSGKSTTLYAALNTINTVERKAVTLEDPIEYDIPGVIQMQVMPEIDLTFARGLRSMLRHDPDVMMVGEVRDFETADIAIRVSLTGHLILSTLHTNDAASAVTRLLDIGVEPYLVASSVIGFMAQRLVRSICANCKEEDQGVLPEVKAMIRKDLRIPEHEEIKFYRGKGCEKCSYTGFLGRLAIHEILIMQEPIRKLILQSRSSEEIKKKARDLGMTTLRQDGWRKVLKGLTTAEEVIMVTPADDLPVTSHSAAQSSEMDITYLPPARNSKEFPEKGNKSESEDPFKDRRKYVRVKVELEVIFRAVNFDNLQEQEKEAAESWSGAGASDNISAGGVAFKTTEMVGLGDVLELHIDLADDHSPVECIGRVLRVSTGNERDSRGSPFHQVAVCFLAIHSVDRLRLEQFCKQRANS